MKPSFRKQVPARKSTLVILSMMVVLTSACGGSARESGPSEPKADGIPDAPAYAMCSSSMSSDRSDAASTGIDLFKPGGGVEAALNENLDIKRGDVSVEPRFVAGAIDASTLLPQTRAIQNSYLAGPVWARAAVAEVSKHATAQCSKEKGEVLAGTVWELEARNSMGAKGLQPGPERIEDLRETLKADDPLMDAFRKVFAVDTPWPRRPEAGSFKENEPAIRNLATQLGEPTQRALAEVVLGMSRAEAWRLAAVRGWFPSRIDYQELAGLLPSSRGPGPSRAVGPMGSVISPQLARRFDYSLMARAGTSLALSVERLKVHLTQSALPEVVDFKMKTPLGEIALTGKRSDDTHEFAAPALIVDQGGADRYRGFAGGPGLESIPFSAVIDLDGADRYEGGDVLGTQGAGILSFGLLLDRAGNDVYEAGELAQGASSLGVGALLDEAGDDIYKAVFTSQGSGHYGLGTAIDLAGNDSWQLTSNGQGYGSVRSAGLLLDGQGNDVYDAQNTNIINPSHSEGQNTSMAQGAATGARAQGRASLSGGTGFLIDLAGADKYSCGIFCQGAGYWFGHGILYDAGGEDLYKGVRYVQGAGAHFALGTLIDLGGNDSYSAVIKMAQGAGHDGSAGFFIDDGGDDQYSSTGLSHGAANDVGHGFFVDAAGADVYGISAGEPNEQGWYGQSNVDGDCSGARCRVRALGFFMDLAGADDYRIGPPEAKNGATWKLPGSAGAPAEHLGFGSDAD